MANTEMEVVTEDVSVPMVEPSPMTFTSPKHNLYRVSIAIIWSFSLGISDGAIGILLYKIQNQFDLTYSEVSIVWLANAMGYVIVACLTGYLQQYLGRKSYIIGMFSSIVMFTFASTGSKYPLIVSGFFFQGIGIGICFSQFNVFMSRLQNSPLALGLFHGSWGLGASTSPLIATGLVEAGIKWNMFYLILLGFSIFNIANCYLAFVHWESSLTPWDPKIKKTDEIEENLSKSDGLMAEAVRTKMTWWASLFVFCYQGAEVSLGGWLTTYLRDYRMHTSTSISYVATCYWFGITLSRLVVTPFIHRKIGIPRANFLLATLAIVFVLLTWLIDNLISEIVTIFISGICIGPIYPLMISHVIQGNLLPDRIQIISMTISSAFGYSGGAVFPFLIGLISQFTKPFVVLPSFIFLFCLMLVFWMMITGFPLNSFKRKISSD